MVCTFVKKFENKIKSVYQTLFFICNFGKAR